MTNLRIKLFTFFILTMLSAPCYGQRGEFVDGANQHFLNKPPYLGEAIEDVKAFAEDGSEFSLGSTRGKHTVLIFGCLT